MAGLAVSASISTRARPRRRRLLQRLAANLIENAIRHNIPGGGVDIPVTPDGGRPG